MQALKLCVLQEIAGAQPGPGSYIFQEVSNLMGTSRSSLTGVVSLDTLSHLGRLLNVSVLLCSIRFRARRRSSARKGVCRAARSNLSSPRPTRVSTLASMGPVQPESVSAPPRPPLRHLSANKVCSVHTEDNTDVVVDLGRCHGRKSAPRSFQGW